ncbi:hypothetical protein CK203_089359 [Vitis vinifera]|uniref:Late embryogenesis abundant protein LEA-2 subgroup domain-containing protein n=1 Tax=Vitis vinifera TaxID=29760 RepID=A0A438D2T0_VITVI|nr:hypothetical protein CK203_089359 [Vitis vinifera]
MITIQTQIQNQSLKPKTDAMFADIGVSLQLGQATQDPACLRHPRWHLPRISFPVVRIQLNITLNLQILVENPNHASFKHGSGQSILLYQGEQVGDVEIYPGNIPGRRSTTIPSRLTLQVDKVASETLHLVQDILAGQLAMDTRTRIPGRVTFLGLIRKHVVAISDCHFVIAVPEMKVRSQECKERTKF